MSTINITGVCITDVCYHQSKALEKCREVDFDRFVANS